MTGFEANNPMYAEKLYRAHIKKFISSLELNGENAENSQL